jgi:L-alanine-DL-glutamate epimerase-like enolase superfamily enzyme
MRVRWNGLEGLGETVPVARYDESVASVLAYFAAHPPTAGDPYALETLLRGIPPAARCLLDCALHDLIGKDLDRPLWRLLGLDPAATPVTSFTIGIDTVATMLAKVDEIRDHPILKIKLDGTRDVETIAAIRDRYTGTIRIDANEAWTPESAVATLAELARYDIEFCEQPIPAGTPERLRFIRERSTIPIVTDEDSKDARDLPALIGCVDGVNVKLVKCGGIRGALEMIHTARALGFKIMLGCMVESAILATAAAQLSPLVDWADLDGPFLTAADPFAGVTYDHGKLVLPDAPGLGVVEREPASAFAPR